MGVASPVVLFALSEFGKWGGRGFAKPRILNYIGHENVSRIDHPAEYLE